MPNYVVEDGIDFFAELNKNYISNKNEKLCLITNTNLLNNNITLSCNHSFNYLPLFLEIKNQKRYNPNESYMLKKNQVRCPYCRQVSQKLIPYVPPSIVGKGVVRINGVNSPDNLCMNHKICTWKFKTGKKKNCECKKAGFETDYGDLCETHWKSTKKTLDKNSKLDNIIWSEEMENLSKNNTVQELKAMLRKKNLKIGGVKKELVIRLINN
tara:strand:- start:273 stop:908 length:636 start_codon:yes stop_codon:yes gene_type:complete